MTDSVPFCTHNVRDINAHAAHDAAAFVAAEEARYVQQITAAADTLANGMDGCRLVWMCGPSSVGKTTTAKRLCAALEARGVSAFTVSLDDFYRRVDSTHGQVDFESPLALDLPQLHRCLSELTATGETSLPQFDFSAKRPRDTRTFLRVTGNSVVILEGIQAFSPLLLQDADPTTRQTSCKLFINTGARFCDGDDTVLCRRDIRLSRRLLRDERTRDTDFERTMAMWQNVLAGDERHIFPFADDADIVINSALGYEPCVLAPLLLERLPRLFGTPYEATAKRLIGVYKRFEPLSPSIVPTDSVLREFIGEN